MLSYGLHELNLDVTVKRTATQHGLLSGRRHHELGSLVVVLGHVFFLLFISVPKLFFIVIIIDVNSLVMSLMLCHFQVGFSLQSLSDFEVLWGV